MQFLAKLGKFTFKIGIFLLIGNVPGQLGIFFSQLGKNLVPETGPSFVKRKSPGSCT